VFGPQVQEAVAALDLVSTFATFNVQLVESATVLDSVIGAYLWNVIDDSQSPDWGPVPASQSAGWVVVDDSQSTNWQNVDDSQAQNWAVVNDGNTVTWTQVTT
jgi:hypothetical protein